MSITDAARSSFYASTMLSIDYQVHVVRIRAEGVDLSVDVMADPDSSQITDQLHQILRAVGAA